MLSKDQHALGQDLDLNIYDAPSMQSRNTSLNNYSVARRGSATACADGGLVGISGHGFLMASCNLTIHLSGPLIQPGAIYQQTFEIDWEVVLTL